MTIEVGDYVRVKNKRPVWVDYYPYYKSIYHDYFLKFVVHNNDLLYVREGDEFIPNSEILEYMTQKYNDVKKILPNDYFVGKHIGYAVCAAAYTHFGNKERSVFRYSASESDTYSHKVKKILKKYTGVKQEDHSYDSDFDYYYNTSYLSKPKLVKLVQLENTMCFLEEDLEKQ